MKAVFAALLLVSLVLTSSLFDVTLAGSEFCDSKCAMRCSKAGVKDRCLKYCGICCEKCKCVPSGTSGNKDECPCYRDIKNSKGKPKYISMDWNAGSFVLLSVFIVFGCFLIIS